MKSVARDIYLNIFQKKIQKFNEISKNVTDANIYDQLNMIPQMTAWASNMSTFLITTTRWQSDCDRKPVPS